jgi:hypothetical protein
MCPSSELAAWWPLFPWSSTRQEKYYQSLAAGAVPVYYGAPDIARFSPTRDLTESVVVVGGVGPSQTRGSVRDRARAVAARLTWLATSRARYDALLRWKRQAALRAGGGPSGRSGPLLEGPLTELLLENAVGSNCRLCRAVRAAIDRGLKRAPKPSAKTRNNALKPKPAAAA